jgi:hypothetical protein
MLRSLKQWFSSRAPVRPPACARRSPSIRPVLEALEDRQLLSAAPSLSGHFVNYNDGSLSYVTPAGNNHEYIDSGVTSLSAGQAIQQTSFPWPGKDIIVINDMVAYVRFDGSAWKWDTGSQSRVELFNSSLGITYNVQSVAAGQQGEVYVLLNSGHLYQFDARGHWHDLGGNIISVTAGTDYSGRSMADVVTGDGTAWEYTTSHPRDGDHGFYRQLTTLFVSNNIKSVAAGRQGISYVLLNSGQLAEYNEHTNQWSDLGGNVASVSAGSTASGQSMAVIMTMDGTAWEWSYTHPWDSDHGFYRQLVPIAGHGQIQSVTAGPNDISDVVMSDGAVWQYDDKAFRFWRWSYLDSLNPGGMSISNGMMGLTAASTADSGLSIDSTLGSGGSPEGGGHLPGSSPSHLLIATHRVS